jgi:cytochrome c peroxidase
MRFQPSIRSLATLVSATVLAACGGAVVDDAAEREASSPIASQDDALLGATAGDTDSLNSAGVLRTWNRAGRIDRTNPFFASLGTNGRSCASCHVAATGWTISPDEVRARFERTDGLDPIFRTNDGSSSPRADVSTKEARRLAYDMLVRRGLLRIGMAMPVGAEFELAAVDDPYGFASASEISLFRRPLPTTNLEFLTAVMWDGRETLPGNTIHLDLGDQANGATRGHAEGAADITAAQRDAIVQFETGLYTAQLVDWRAGDLRTGGASGGPAALSVAPFFFGINDPFGGNPTGAPFDANAFGLYQAWGGDGRSSCGAGLRDVPREVREAREQVARGELLFDTLPIDIQGVKGINDDLDTPVLRGHCTTCHDTPNIGNHSLAAPLDIGIAHADRRTTDMPLYTLRNRATGESVQVTDPGRAMISGRWKDIGRFKGPVLRGLAARPPYFHDGSAASLPEVVKFYDERFGLGLAPLQKADLVAFLRTL